MRALAALLIALSFFATHAAGDAFARAAGPVEAPAIAIAPVELAEPTDGRLACCPQDEAASEADSQHCQQSDCLFLLPGLVLDVDAARPAIGVHQDSGLTDRPGRMVHPPPIS